MLAKKNCPGPTPRLWLIRVPPSHGPPALTDALWSCWGPNRKPARRGFNYYKLGYISTPPVANEGLVRDSLLNNVINPGDDWHPGCGGCWNLYLKSVGNIRSSHQLTISWKFVAKESERHLAWKKKCIRNSTISKMFLYFSTTWFLLKSK